ncbi:transmembrane and coiled-coil domain-containing protein 4 isoform X2 [Tupaia chinensis]|uniref:transmembrane and coiled-coil domain-containing protein 4 isoform X2 n=1 Tax=Tupaia chinensis TaxID=246437 RepID=UPI000FFB269F|nr:transmembrane and coiled-coil domain-containing protein 4 isoform X2 [Tupaia chinensis]
MATWDRPSRRQPQAAEPAAEGEPNPPTGRELTEANRFAYAALCGISLSQLFPEPEQSSFCTEFVTGLVKWLELSEAVLPTMTAFASGLGGEGADMFAQILLKDPVLKEDPSVITQDLLSFSLKDGRYDARARVLVCHMTSLLQVSLEELDFLEETFLESLKEIKEEESEMAEASRKKKENRRKWKRYLLIGLATVGGGTVIGVTGGLAAPLVAAGAATIIGSAGAAALGSVAGIAVMTSLFGAAGAGLTGYKMKKRVGAIEEFTFLPLTEGKQLHITIAVTGWLASGKYRTFNAPWAVLARSREQYCLAWEAKYLMELGNALETILSGLANMVAQEALKYTVLSGIVAALTLPASLLSVANVIDNPWGVCLHRSAEVGKHLAHILLSRQQIAKGSSRTSSCWVRPWKETPSTGSLSGRWCPEGSSTATAGQRPLGLCQADGCHPEGRGHPHQARLGREGPLAGARQPVTRGASPGSSHLLLKRDHPPGWASPGSCTQRHPQSGHVY